MGRNAISTGVTRHALISLVPWRRKFKASPANRQAVCGRTVVSVVLALPSLAVTERRGRDKTR
jgi:hypothetical protein